MNESYFWIHEVIVEIVDVEVEELHEIGDDLLRNDLKNAQHVNVFAEEAYDVQRGVDEYRTLVLNAGLGLLVLQWW